MSQAPIKILQPGFIQLFEVNSSTFKVSFQTLESFFYTADLKEIKLHNYFTHTKKGCYHYYLSALCCFYHIMLVGMLFLLSIFNFYSQILSYLLYYLQILIAEKEPGLCTFNCIWQTWTWMKHQIMLITNPENIMVKIKHFLTKKKKESHFGEKGEISIINFYEYYYCTYQWWDVTKNIFLKHCTWVQFCSTCSFYEFFHLTLLFYACFIYFVRLTNYWLIHSIRLFT